jgi:hypothetical protein
MPHLAAKCNNNKCNKLLLDVLADALDGYVCLRSYVEVI